MVQIPVPPSGHTACPALPGLCPGDRIAGPGASESKNPATQPLPTQLPCRKPGPRAGGWGSHSPRKSAPTPVLPHLATGHAGSPRRPLGWLMLVGCVFTGDPSQPLLVTQGACHSPGFSGRSRVQGSLAFARQGTEGAWPGGRGARSASPCGAGVPLAMPGPEGQGTGARKARKTGLHSLSPLWSREFMQESRPSGVWHRDGMGL